VNYFDMNHMNYQFAMNLMAFVSGYGAQVYRELEDSIKHEMVYHSVSVPGPLHGVPVKAPYQPLGLIARKRLQAMRSSTTYCYDFPLVITPLLFTSTYPSFFSVFFCCEKGGH